MNFGKQPVKKLLTEDKKDAVQAIILADSFNIKFAPITLEIPRALLPIANIPLLDYTIEFLSTNGIEEIFVFCRSHAAQIEKHIEETYSMNGNGIGGLKVNTITSSGVVSAGDALREIYDCNVITGDFVLVSGDVISNLDLHTVLNEHRVRRIADKKNIMTMVFLQAGPKHRSRSISDSTIVGFNPVSNTILAFDSHHKSQSISLESNLLINQHHGVVFRHDLIDTNLAICSKDVLFLFKEHFDYQDIRKDFVKGILSSEISDDKIHGHFASGYYSTLIQDISTYFSVTFDVVSRWCYPIVPDANWSNQKTNYQYTATNPRNSIYIEKPKPKIGVTSKILATCVIAKNTIIKENCKIENCIIGRNCMIGNNVILNNVIIWDNVKINDNVTISSSIICDGVNIANNVTIQPNSIISFNINLTNNEPQNQNLIVESGTRLTLKQVTDPNTPPSFQPNEDWSINNNSKNQSNTTVYNNQNQNAGTFSDTIYCWEDSSIDQDSDSDDDSNDDPQTFTNQLDDQSDYQSDQKKFFDEALSTFVRAFEEDHSVDNTLLEINALKFAYNQTALECANAVLISLFNIAYDTSLKEKKTKVQTKNYFNKLLSSWSELFTSFRLDVEGQVEIIYIVQEYAQEREEVKQIFHFILKQMYDVDFIEEDAILDWSSEQQNSTDLSFYTQCKPFIEWLQQSSEEESESDD